MEHFSRALNKKTTLKQVGEEGVSLEKKKRALPSFFLEDSGLKQKNTSASIKRNHRVFFGDFWITGQPFLFSDRPKIFFGTQKSFFCLVDFDFDCFVTCFFPKEREREREREKTKKKQPYSLFQTPPPNLLNFSFLFCWFVHYFSL